MKIEKEYRYTGMNTETLERMFLTAQQMSIPKLLSFKRAVFDIPGKDGFLRLRTDGYKTTLTIKITIRDASERVSSAEEHEVEVGSFDETMKMLEILGYIPRSVQYNYRILFVLEKGEFSIDLWPDIGQVIEIESDTEEDIQEIESMFENLKDFHTTKRITHLYNDVGIDVANARLVEFKEVPELVGKYFGVGVINTKI